MKRISSKVIFTTAQKKEISMYTKTLIERTMTMHIQDKDHLLVNIVHYAKSNDCPDLLLKQTLLKGCFPKVTWSKQQLLHNSALSEKLDLAYPKEVSDVRFLTELIIGDSFAESSSLIQKIIFNSENPKVAVATPYGNPYKDIALHFAVGDHAFIENADIKSGNNAFGAYQGVVGYLPILNNNTIYSVINESPFTLDILQAQRLKYMQKQQLANGFTSNQKSIYNNIKDIMQDSALDPAFANTLIQNELIHYIVASNNKVLPSFYATRKVSIADIHEKYFKLLEPHINENIFDNKKNFNQFMSKAIRVFNDHINNITENIANNFWEGTGFENIAYDIFK